MAKRKTKKSSAKKSSRRSSASKLTVQLLALPLMALLREVAGTLPPAPPTLWWQRYRGELGGTFGVMLGLLIVALALNITQLQGMSSQPTGDEPSNHYSYGQLRDLRAQASALEAAQAQAGVQVSPADGLNQELAAIQISLESGNRSEAKQLMAQLKQELTADEPKLTAAISAKQAADAATAAAAKAAHAAALAAAAPRTPATASANVPILIYHKPPDDFDAQMEVLQQRGYTTITLDLLAAALHGHASLPPKPVIITFDDGFEAQESVIPYLEAHNLKAAFFIIDGGAVSNYCIGANRSNASCGDAYMSWDEIRQLDQNPLFTIGSHTVDHLDLAQQPVAVQQFQIDQGKQQLEQQLGHSVDDFAYPDGGYTNTTLNLVSQAGFVTAVTTNPGTIQSAGGLLTLSRIRATYYLP